MPPKKKAAKKKAAPKKAVAKRKKEEVVEQSMMDQFAKDAGQGLETIGKDDTKIPFLRVLQALSPQLQDGDPQEIEGAKAGMLLNSVTGDTWDGKEGVMLIPVHFEKVYIEWKPRASGGGFVAEWRTREEAMENCQEGNEIVDTAHHYCLLRNEEDMWAPIVLPCKSTFLSASRGWNAMMQSVMFKHGEATFTPPSFACIYSLTTARQQNDQGTWHNILIERVANVEDVKLYGMAKAFRHTLTQGGAQLSYETLVDEEVVEGDDTPSF